MKAKVNKVTIQITQDAALKVNAAGLVTITGTRLTVDAELLNAAGSDVLQQAQQIGYAPVGDAAITGAGRLSHPQRIIHAVAPRWTEDNARAKLAQVTWRCVELAEEYQLKSVVIPPISTGTFGYPIEACARVMIEEIIDFTFEKPRFLKTIIFSTHTPANAYDVFLEELHRQLEDLARSGDGQVSV